MDAFVVLCFDDSCVNKRFFSQTLVDFQQQKQEPAEESAEEGEEEPLEEPPARE